MKRPSLQTMLAPAPACVQASMLADPDTLRRGAAAVVGRFFRTVAERGEHWSAPSRASCDVAAASEPTLHTLLKTLEVHAPQVSLGPGRDARKAWYQKRPKTGAPRQKGPATVASQAPQSWPQEWRSLYSGLRDAPISSSSIRRYIASINRCADVIAQTDATPDLGFYCCWCLYEELRGQGLKARSIAGYIDGLSALALHGGRTVAERAGLIRVRTYLGRLADLDEKEKVERIRTFVENGGFETVVSAIADLREAADTAPAWTATAERARQTAAILGVSMNAPARTGDVAVWRIGHELIRHPSGDWELVWRQEKNDREADFGLLWPEISEIIDHHVLGGRPDRLILHRYQELAGLNWLSLHQEPFASRWPSEQAKKALGIPLHDLRTIAADYLRWHDPATAAATVSALLGHGTKEAGKAYSAMTQGEAAARSWQDMRQAIAGRKGQLV